MATPLAAESRCPRCGRSYRYVEERRCWTCDGPVCPECAPPGKAPLCPACSRRVLGDHLRPMLAASGGLPRRSVDWGFEFKWDGVRVLAEWDGLRLRLYSRNGREVTSHYPELGVLHDRLGARPVLLDGEVVALDAQGRPSFARLQHRMHPLRPDAALVRAVPVVYFVFDVLVAGGRRVWQEPYDRRRRTLERLRLAGGAIRVPPSVSGDGARVLDTARRMRLEGVMAKRLDSPYEPGRRSSSWRKIKLVRQQDVVIGGWTTRRDSSRRVGALLTGTYDTRGRLRYAGRVGTGFSETDHARLTRALRERARTQSPFAGTVPDARHAHWTAPQLVAAVTYRRWPTNHVMQQAAFLGLRTDQEPLEVHREQTLA